MTPDPNSVSKSSLRELEREALLKKKKNDRRRTKRQQKEKTLTGITADSERIGTESADEFEIEYIPESIGEEYADLMFKFAPVVSHARAGEDEGLGDTSGTMIDVLDVESQRRAAEAAAATILEMTEKSNREKRLESRMSIVALKSMVDRPDLVDVMDNCSPDPLTLLFLKSYKNVVQVPRHWSTKRNYMAAKRGIDKPPFKLPEYVEQTGIAKIRQAVLAKEAEKDIKAKQRAKMRPKVGKLDIDYQVLHDAFFKYQTRPNFLTKYGDIYFEGRENETRFFHKKPGHISASLREALGIVDLSLPPPWLISMQRFGPPPSYPNMRIPGLNAPIPVGTEWGYHPGGWGKPPVDQFGNPVYGGAWNPDVDRQPILDIEQIIGGGKNKAWGEFEPEPESDDDEIEDYVAPAVTPAAAIPTPVQPVYSQGVAVVVLPAAPKPAVPVTGGSLYKVIPQRSAPTQPGALFPSRQIYELKPSDSATGGVATASGIAQRTKEIENEDNLLTAEMIKKKLADLESKTAKPPKKKSKFKF